MPSHSIRTRRAIRSWVLFDWAAQPYFTLILTFLFAPYFARVLVGDAVLGQSLWGYGQAVAGLLIAVSAPICGAWIDHAGRRKIWLLLFSLLFVSGCCVLWWAAPGGTMPILAVLIAVLIAQCGVELSTVVTNAMLPDIAGEKRGGVSGSGMAVGYLGGLVSLILVLAVFTTGPEPGQTMLGLPELGMTQDTPYFAERVVGPLSAIWYMVFIIPLFLYVPDRTRLPNAEGVQTSNIWRVVISTLRMVKGNRGAIRFLIARMAYQDGLVALFAFGGIFAAGSFGWRAQELGIFGIILSISAGIGAYLGGKLDDRLGPKKVILMCLAALIVCCGLITFLQGDDGVAALTSATGLAFLSLGFCLGLAVGPVQAASRTLLIGLAPPEKITSYFGLYALSGKASAFLAPLTVALATTITGRIEAGLFVIIGFFVIGIILLAPLKFSSRRP